MKILVEIDLPEMDLNDFFGVKSNIFDNKGNVYINKNNLNFVDETFALLKYAGHLEDEPRL